MSAATRTGIFWAVAVVMVGIATIVAWPTPTKTELGSIVGKPLFENFEDPLNAASLKIVTYDPEQSELEPFEVRKDLETGVWTIPSRQGYPADAVEQMKKAANSLVGLRILDIQTENPEDHDDLGVVEPKLEDAQAGGEGVGRLVTFRDESKDTLASLIIGKPVEDSEGQIYVRKPGQDPVYVVKLDDGTLTTDFQEWIEEDLLQLSSIDLKQMVLKDYNASTNIGGQISLARNYTAELSTDGSQWQLDRLLEYDPQQPMADPTEVEVPGDKELNQSKLDEITNALDDLTIADVVRKPEGMSASLRADEELISDNEAVSSLASRGFYPVSSGAAGETEVLAANGELTTTTNDGVRYVLRFGDVSGLADEQSSGESGETSSSGLNRYLLVTARVAEDQFPPPDLQEVPQDLDDLRKLLSEQSEQQAQASSEQPANIQQPAQPAQQPAEPAQQPAGDQPAGDAADEPAGAAASDASAEASSASTDETMPPQPSDQPQPAGGDADPASSDGSGPEETNSAEPGEQAAEVPADPSDNEPSDVSEQPAAATEDESGEADQAGDSAAVADRDAVRLVAAQAESAQDGPAEDGPAENEAGQEDADQDEPAEDDLAPAEGDPAPAEADSAEPAGSDAAGDSDASSEGEPGDDQQPDSSGQPSGDATQRDDQAALSELEGLTEEEKLERLEAEQEKITKANQRKIDRRNDEIESARRRVRELNSRFADWYYVIPEQTYRKLRVERDELFASAQEAAAPPSGRPSGAGQPSFQFPNLPGGTQ